MVTTVSDVERRAGVLKDKLQLLRTQLAERGKGSPEVASPKVNLKSDAMNGDAKPLTTPRNPDRPQSLDDMIGQEEAVLQLRLAIAGATLRDEPFGHVLVTGGPGLGKSSLAQIVAGEMGVPLISTTGMLLKKSTDVIGLMMGVSGGACLFIDECHTMGSQAATVLYQVAEDGAVDLLAGTGPDVAATTKPLPGLVIVAATTHPGKLSQSFRDRLNVQITMAEYSDDEIAQIIRRYWKSRKVQFFKGEDFELARRSRGIPRTAIALASHVLDWVAVNGQTTINTGNVDSACAVQGIDSRGHNKIDRAILTALTIGPFSSKPVGLDNLAAYLNVEPSTIESAHEGFLVRQGLVIRTGRGRSATAKAHELMREES